MAAICPPHSKEHMAGPVAHSRLLGLLFLVLQIASNLDPSSLLLCDFQTQILSQSIVVTLCRVCFCPRVPDGLSLCFLPVYPDCIHSSPSTSSTLRQVLHLSAHWFLSSLNQLLAVMWDQELGLSTPVVYELCQPVSEHLQGQTLSVLPCISSCLCVVYLWFAQWIHNWLNKCTKGVVGTLVITLTVCS